jgi:hypothetical protein
MLGIDITLQKIETASFPDETAILAIELMNLQATYISIKTPTTSSNPNPNPNSSKISEQSPLSNKNYGKGSFSIIEHSDSLLKSILESVVTLKVSILGKDNEKPYEFASGLLENLSLKECIKTSNTTNISNIIDLDDDIISPSSGTSRVNNDIKVGMKDGMKEVRVGVRVRVKVTV